MLTVTLMRDTTTIDIPEEPSLDLTSLGVLVIGGTNWLQVDLQPNQQMQDRSTVDICFAKTLNLFAKFVQEIYLISRSKTLC